MKKSDEKGVKSAYELAMERLDEREGKRAPVSEEQKKALAEVDERARAKMAELEIMMKQRVIEARASGEVSKLPELEEERARDSRRVREEAESEKDRIRRGGNGG